MACSIQECERMLDACRTTGARLAINHPMRFMPCYTEPKRILASEEFGGLTSMTVLGGNFGVAMNGTHFFEAFRYISDEEPDEVTAWFDELNVPNPRGPQFEDRAGSIRITSARGKRFYMECGASQGHGITAVYGGPYGQLMVDHLAGTMTSNIREAEHRNLPSTRYGMPSTRTNIKLDTADLVQLCSSVASALFEDAGYPTGEDGMLAIRTLVAAHVSHESGHVPVRVHSNVIPTDRPFPWA
jgi:predicted dehydrogenase